eukprot:TRINITY_DN3105_c0_g1_i1.p1 TRINITY_DN3105_c0_g1~~TRINITY_DN3105_c0_g1_i1.p1  ORF type:complete len:611 (-),score=131.46 TRINITY_DN3105_c0_g1_i1:1000-2832(-)
MDSSEPVTENVHSQPSGVVPAPSNDEIVTKDESPQLDGSAAERSSTSTETATAGKIVPPVDDLDAKSVLERTPPGTVAPSVEALETADAASGASPTGTKKSYLAAKGQTALNFIERTFTTKKGSEVPSRAVQDADNRESVSPNTENPERKFGEEWPEKALAFKNFMRDGGKNVVDGGKTVVSNVVDGSKNVVTNVVDGSRTVVGKVMRRLSGKKEDLDRTDEADKGTIPEDDHEGEVEDEVQGREMKGRITIFSVSGSPDCRAAKSLFAKRGIKFVEINLDVFPDRSSELEEKSKTLDVPQVFFNDVLIGGLDQLIALEESGQLDDKLEVVYENEPNQSTPLPPVYGDQVGTLDEYIELVKTLRSKLAIKDRFLKYRVINKCFVGSEAVDIVMEDQHITREMAVELVRSIASKHFFYHVLQEHVFEDGNHFYRFLEHNPQVQSKCLNFTGATNDLEPRSCKDVGNDLKKLILAMYDAYVSEDGKHVDYEGISKSEEFKRYVKTTEDLQRVDLAELSREEKLALFLNIYNALVIHAIAELRRNPSGPIERRSFFSEVQYVIGGQVYSLSGIENGLLRANRRAPYNLTKPYNTKDPRLQRYQIEPCIEVLLI